MLRSKHSAGNRRGRSEVVSAVVGILSFGAMFLTWWYGCRYVAHGAGVACQSGGVVFGYGVLPDALGCEPSVAATEWLPGVYRDPTVTVIFVPLWIPGVVALGCFWILRSRRVRSRPGHCPTCEYDLTGNESGVCPECGTPVAKKTDDKRIST